MAVGRAGEDPDFSARMHGTPAAAAADAELDVYPIDDAGNWPMKMHVSGLADGRYELVLDARTASRPSRAASSSCTARRSRR